MTKEKEPKKVLNKDEIHIDRGLELMLESRREVVEPIAKSIEFKIKLFKFEVSFAINKCSQGNDPCKQH